MSYFEVIKDGKTGISSNSIIIKNQLGGISSQILRDWNVQKGISSNIFLLKNIDFGVSGNTFTNKNYLFGISSQLAKHNLKGISSNINLIKTSLDNMDNSVDGNYLNINMNVAGTDVASNAGTLNAQTLRVTIATDDEVNNLLGTIDTDTSNMATSLGNMDNSVDFGVFCRVSILLKNDINFSLL